jgi:hypothetical protein
MRVYSITPKRDGPPFHAVGPVLPPDFQQGQKFSVYTHCEVLNLAEVEALERHRDKIWSLTLLGPECNDSTLESLPTFPAMQVLDLTYTGTTGSGLVSLDRQPKIRVLKILAQQSQQLDLGMLAHLPSLNSLIIWHTPSLSFDFRHRSTRLPNLNHLDLQCYGLLRLDGQTPNSMWALTFHGQSLKGTLTCCNTVEHLSLHLAEDNENEIIRFAESTNGVKFLNLSRTPVSDALVGEFVNRWPLEFLDISQTQVTEEFAARLAQLHPALRVVHNKGFIKSSRAAPRSDS